MIDVVRLDVMSIRGHGPWANFLRERTIMSDERYWWPGYTSTGQWPCLRRVRSLIVFASSTVQWPKLPGYTCLRRAISSRKKNCIRDAFVKIEEKMQLKSRGLRIKMYIECKNYAYTRIVRKVLSLMKKTHDFCQVIFLFFNIVPF